MTPFKSVDKSLSPKQLVLKKYPHAWCAWYADDCCVIKDQDTPNIRLGGGTAPKDAWADAARKL